MSIRSFLTKARGALFALAILTCSSFVTTVYAADSAIDKVGQVQEAMDEKMTDTSHAAPLTTESKSVLFWVMWTLLLLIFIGVLALIGKTVWQIKEGGDDADKAKKLLIPLVLIGIALFGAITMMFGF